MLSVIFATHNGEEILPRTLGAMAGVQRPPCGVEFIAVDNASTDRTPEILQAYERPLPLRILHEPRRGKSYALNAGIEAAQGALLVFTDDDVLPDPDWLAAYAEAAAAHPDTGIFAGQVRHAWDAPPPRWLDRLAAAGLSYAGTPQHWEIGPLSHAGYKGPNMMARRAAVGSIRFSEKERVNYTGTHTSAGGVDTRFAYEVIDAGAQSRFLPQACVRHIVRAHQIGLRPVFQRYMRIGAGEAHQHDLPVNAIQLFSYPLQDIRVVLRHATRLLYRLARRDEELAARRMTMLAKALGRLRERRRMKE